MTNRMPKPVIKFNSTSTMIAALVNGSGYGEEHYPWAERFIGRFPLPAWQRGLVWTLEQKSLLLKVYSWAMTLEV